MKTNLILASDAYKFCHYNLLPANTEATHLYIEARGGAYKETVFFGLQYLLKEYLTTPIIQANIDEAVEVCSDMGIPFNHDGWKHILAEHKGLLPIRIRAVPEGTVVPISNVLMTIESTCPKCFWVPGVMETLLMKVWYPTTVASRSYAIRRTILDALNTSSDDPNSEIDFKLHSFGYRGVSSEESAGLGGAAELISFKGTDTIRGLLFARDYYGAKNAGFSIPATEHSVITAYGKANESKAYKRFLNEYGKPGTIIACVSDSYDLWNAITNIFGNEMKEDIIKSGAVFVVRPDSGDPVSVVRQTLSKVDMAFGHITNSKGYKVLNHVRVIQGDGINERSIKDIIDAVLLEGYSMTNLGFGMGGGMLQQLDRDTCKFACKLSNIKVAGEWRDVSKAPATDPGKASKPGRLDLVMGNGGYETVRLSAERSCKSNTAMQTVYENGELLVDDTFDAIRVRAKK